MMMLMMMINEGSFSLVQFVCLVLISFFGLSYDDDCSKEKKLHCQVGFLFWLKS